MSSSSCSRARASAGCAQAPTCAHCTECSSTGTTGAADAFFRTEYATNALIGEFAKPIVAVDDGVMMGGGIGVSGHAAVRVVTETSQLAMPETRLGFTPDAGGSWLLSRAPGRLGEYLALTSDTMDAADALHCGFADFFVPSERVDDLVDAFETRADPQTPAELIMLFDETPEPSRLARDHEWIDDAFAADTVGGDRRAAAKDRRTAAGSSTRGALGTRASCTEGDARGHQEGPWDVDSARRARTGVRPGVVVRAAAGPTCPRASEPRSSTKTSGPTGRRRRWRRCRRNSWRRRSRTDRPRRCGEHRSARAGIAALPAR